MSVYFPNILFYYISLMMLKIWMMNLNGLLLPFVHKLMLPEVVGSPCDISAEVAFVSEQFLTMFSLHMPSKISFVAKVLPSTSGTPPGPINLGHMHGHIRGNDFSTFPTCKIVIALSFFSYFCLSKKSRQNSQFQSKYKQRLELER